MKLIPTSSPVLWTLRPGDIILVRGKGWVSDDIAKAEYGPVEPANAVTHTGVITAVMPGYEPQVTEALTRVRTHPISVTLASAQKAWALQTDMLTDVQRGVIVSAALGFSADSYGYFDLVLQWLDAKTGSDWWTRKWAWFLKEKPICSYVVAASYVRVGWGFGINPNTVTPRDISDYGSAHPDVYPRRIPLSLP